MKEIHLTNGSIVRVQAITPAVFRVRMRPDDGFGEPGLVRYGVVRSDWPAVECAVAEDAESVTFATSQAALTLRRDDGRVSLADASGKALVRQDAPPRSDPRSGFDVRFALTPEEKLYGLGDETRDRIQKRGHQGMMVVRNVESYAPIPFLMSTAGWGIFLNTTWFHSFDAGATDPNTLRFRSDQGELDYYLIAGATLPELLDRYTQVTGRPSLLPLWGYGLTFVCDDRNVRARAGAIIPTYPDMLYVGQVSLDRVGIEVFPQGESCFTLYEDDGVTEAYREGKVATTEIRCRATDGEVLLQIAPRAGTYDGMPEARRFDVRVHLDWKPAEVFLGGTALPEGESGWRYDREEKVLLLAAGEDPERRKGVVVQIRR